MMESFIVPADPLTEITHTERTVWHKFAGLRFWPAAAFPDPGLVSLKGSQTRVRAVQRPRPLSSTFII